MVSKVINKLYICIGFGIDIVRNFAERRLKNAHVRRSDNYIAAIMTVLSEFKQKTGRRFEIVAVQCGNRTVRAVRASRILGISGSHMIEIGIQRFIIRGQLRRILHITGVFTAERANRKRRDEKHRSRQQNAHIFFKHIIPFLFPAADSPRRNPSHCAHYNCSLDVNNCFILSV